VVSMSSTPAIVGFLDQVYCYKSVATQIPHSAKSALPGINPGTAGQ
jgi:hypothetical protein